jgi:hypothetical protein
MHQTIVVTGLSQEHFKFGIFFKLLFFLDDFFHDFFASLKVVVLLSLALKVLVLLSSARRMASAQKWHWLGLKRLKVTAPLHHVVKKSKESSVLRCQLPKESE